MAQILSSRPVVRPIPCCVCLHEPLTHRRYCRPVLDCADAGLRSKAKHCGKLVLVEAQRLPSLFELCWGHFDTAINI